MVDRINSVLILFKDLDISCFALIRLGRARAMPVGDRLPVEVFFW
jgi:hypothetical protein